MSCGPWINYDDMSAFGSCYFMLHLDLKPPNVLIGKSRRQEEMEESSTSEGNTSPGKRRRLDDDGDSAKLTLPDHFPAIKVHDFGLAEITAVDDDDDPMQYFSSGSPAYKPPVSRTMSGVVLPSLTDADVVPYMNNDTTRSSRSGMLNTLADHGSLQWMWITLSLSRFVSRATLPDLV